MLQIQKNLSTFVLIAASFSLIGCSSSSKEDGTPALFNTKAEAEQAAKNFNCTGAHAMGGKWMPCKSHKIHENHQNYSDSRDHHHHNH